MTTEELTAKFKRYLELEDLVLYADIGRRGKRGRSHAAATTRYTTLKIECRNLGIELRDFLGVGVGRRLELSQ